MELPGMLIDPAWVREQLSRRSLDGLVIADVRWVRNGSSREAYERGHLPGSVFLDADVDLAAPPFDGPGRHPLPSPDAFAAAMERVGIGDDSAVIAYDDVGGSVAARLWWMLRVFDRNVALLDLPSLEVWVEGGGALDVGHPPGPPREASFTPTPWPVDRVVDTASVLRALSERSAVVLDARAGERYRGESEPIDPVAGHIPGAVSAEWTGNRGVDRWFLEPDALRRRYEAMGVGPGDDPIASCGSGLTAALTLFSIERAGLGLGRLYEGSWSDWVSDPARPVAIGAEPGDPA